MSASQVKQVREALALYPLEKGNATPSEVGDALMQAIAAQSLPALKGLAAFLMQQELVRVPGLLDALALLPHWLAGQASHCARPSPASICCFAFCNLKLPSQNNEYDVSLTAIDRADEAIRRDKTQRAGQSRITWLTGHSCWPYKCRSAQRAPLHACSHSG